MKKHKRKVSKKRKMNGNERLENKNKRGGTNGKLKKNEK